MKSCEEDGYNNCKKDKEESIKKLNNTIEIITSNLKGRR